MERPRESDRSSLLLAAARAIARAAAEYQDLEAIAGLAAQEIRTAFHSTKCAVFLLASQRACILAKLGFERDEEIFFSSALPDSEPSIEIFMRDAAAQPGQVYAPVVQRRLTRGFIVVQPERDITTADKSLLALTADILSLCLEAAELHSKVRELAIHDELTGCLTRRKFDEDIEIEIPCAERYGRPLSLLLLRAINPAQGSPLAEADFIRGIGETLAYSIRMCDRLYRYDELTFAILFPGIDKERALFAADRLMKVVSRSLVAAGFGTDREIKKGVASFPADAVYKDGLLRVAVAALEGEQ